MLSEEELKKIAEKTMDAQIMKNLDSTLIFAYIRNLEKELDFKNKEIERLNCEIEGKDCIIDTQSHNEDVLLEVIDKKDKVIDKMAEKLSTDYHSKEWVVKHFEDLIEWGI